MSAVIDVATAIELLDQPRLAVVGATDHPSSFGRTVYQALRSNGCDAVAVHPRGSTVDGDPCHPDLSSVPGPVDGAIIMVNRDAALEVVRDCVALGIPGVWLFEGLGGPAAVSTEAVELCERHSISVVAGACPLMFLDPVGWPHRVHRRLRAARGALSLVG
jgi:uncharacterized protein